MTTLFMVDMATEKETEIDWKRIAKFSIGADPEFIFEQNGDKINADRVFRNSSSDDYDSEYEEESYDDDNDERSEYNYRDTYGEMGMDGHCATAEIRPKHAFTPLGLVKNIQGLFRKSILKVPQISELNWRAGAYKHSEPIGGHIHFGIGLSEWNNRNLTQALDIFLATNLMQLEIGTEAKDRKESYGRMGDLREQNWGVEYRTPSSWIHSPAVAMAVLSLAKHIINQTYVNRQVFSSLSANDLFGLSYTSLRERYKQHDVVFFRNHNDKIWNVIDSWPMDPDVKEGVEIFKAMMNKSYRFGFGDFKKNWGMNVKKADLENAVTVDEVWK